MLIVGNLLYNHVIVFGCLEPKEDEGKLLVR
jgi:hypothetical protein